MFVPKGLRRRLQFQIELVNNFQLDYVEISLTCERIPGELKVKINEIKSKINEFKVKFNELKVKIGKI